MPKLPKPPKGWVSKDVYWYLKSSKRKKPIAYSTTAASNLIAELSRVNPNSTIFEIRKLIVYDEEAKKVLDKYIEYGEGNNIASKQFK